MSTGLSTESFKREFFGRIQLADKTMFRVKQTGKGWWGVAS
jgi:hypothetical protein